MTRNNKSIALPKYVLVILIISWFAMAGGMIFLDIELKTNLQRQADTNGQLITEGVLCLYHQTEDPPIEECRTFLQTVEDDNGN